ncbi:glutamate 5-kinase [Paucidesulfovibrio gracilis DSM 16080]|uniref:Glutamate 5-kinase n=1 Tax=Paucidesulfovibrio gracilis DSM 16080 TaxID=1121449 RepID=A0A1T4W9B7_9BACT|nr:glutamate 5-kinase [Paucidesulfovibrio gracilis]SKA73638.1 glutamate 5-kinase [Paucidesulfovibrio gracilis DSM 16080]
MNSDQRRELLASARRVVIKVGSAVLTMEDGLDLNMLRHLAREINALRERGLDVLLVSSGAVAAGRRRIQFMRPDAAHLSDLPGRQAASAIGQGRLMHEYDRALAELGVVAAQVLLTREGLRIRERFLNARNTLNRLLDWGAVPIINENDTVSVKELQFGDNDTLASLAVGLVEADLFINLTSADGVYDKNPDQHPEAKRLDVIEDIGSLDIPAMCDGKTAVGSGGMYSKMRAARRVAQLGAPTLILSGRKGFSLGAVLDGAPGGTLVLPCEQCVSSKKFWLAYHDQPAGTIVVDDGAARALTELGKSLLPAGIVEVRGEFGQGALTAIRSKTDRVLGVGMCNYSSEQLQNIKGLRSSDIQEQYGEHAYEEAIHRDNMLLDPAI